MLNSTAKPVAADVLSPWGFFDHTACLAPSQGLLLVTSYQVGGVARRSYFLLCVCMKIGRQEYILYKICNYFTFSLIDGIKTFAVLWTGRGRLCLNLR